MVVSALNDEDASKNLRSNIDNVSTLKRANNDNSSKILMSALNKNIREKFKNMSEAKANATLPGCSKDPDYSPNSSSSSENKENDEIFEDDTVEKSPAHMPSTDDEDLLINAEFTKKGTLRKRKNSSLRLMRGKFKNFVGLLKPILLNLLVQKICVGKNAMEKFQKRGACF